MRFRGQGLVLAIETSCDDTCASVVDGDGVIRSNVISSQHVHDRFGGVVPEIAARHHLQLMNVVVSEALAEARTSLDEIELVAVTQGPGLIGALLVGLCAAKAIAAGRRVPLAPVDHLQGHVSANFLSESFEPPFLCLIASGGHTLLAEVEEHDRFNVVGRCIDDAAGEAFDKGARMLGLGYPGGPALERLAAEGDPCAFEFPGANAKGRGRRGGRGRAYAQGLDFSFAGVKTALLYRLQQMSEADAAAQAANLAASYQHAIVESLADRAERALERLKVDRLALGGGVAANGALRRRMEQIGARLHVPARELCTDNAAMIGSAARFQRALPYPRYLALDAYATGQRAL